MNEELKIIEGEVIKSSLSEDAYPGAEIVLAPPSETTAIVHEPGLGRGHDVPGDQNPATVYLASLGSEKSRRVMLSALNVIASILTGSNEDAYSLDWGTQLQLCQTMWAELAQPYSHTRAYIGLTLFKHLSR